MKRALLSRFVALAGLWPLWLAAALAPSVASETAGMHQEGREPSAHKDHAAASGPGWESVYRERLSWWSLQPVAEMEPPPVQRTSWAQNDVDRFVLAALEKGGLQPAPEAPLHALARRLSFALTGLPPSRELLDRFVSDASPDAYDRLVDALISSPHFGERWARHWMDVVHYSDTHGYEWDVPAKNAWMYRDYLIRAFNEDVPFCQLVLEHIAGDLVEPRIDPRTRLNEALIGTMAMRLGERRHGDNAAAEGVTQEAVANVIDTLGKGFLATTLACAQCHDHKLDAVAQKDYYALAGALMSTRWVARCVDAVDRNESVLRKLRDIKRQIRKEIAGIWSRSRDDLTMKIRSMPADDKLTNGFPETLAAIWQRAKSAPISPEAFADERRRRQAENRANLRLIADFTRDDENGGWQWEGSGMRHGLVRDGEIVIADEGNAALVHLLPAGRWTHAWSMRLAGAVRSPLIEPIEEGRPRTFSLGLAGGHHAAYSFIVDHALHSERMQFVNRPVLGWLTLTAGNFDTLAGSVDHASRRVYFELATKSLNNYFPPRTGYGGVTEGDVADERSWFGVTRIYEHPPGKPPLDELTCYAPLFTAEGDWATRIADLISSAIDRFSRDDCDGDCVRLLNEALQLGLLANDLESSPKLAQLVADYRMAEKELQPDRTIGAMADWNEGFDERIAVRGSYTDLGEQVARGNVACLGGPAERAIMSSSGRLELARNFADPANPLTARVFVNRVWLYLFGEGLVRTPDDFGHLGDRPSHGELVDYLTVRFVREGWSLKKLVKLLVTSATWRQSSAASAAALEVDPENRLWHHMPPRRLEAEAVRDAMLAVSGRLDATFFGPSIDPYRSATDASKRLFCGPLDGGGRRSIYIKMTLMEPPRFLAIFNQPIPKLTAGRRDVTAVPEQALALLNDPFVVAMARHWSERVVANSADSANQRAAEMLVDALARLPNEGEIARLVELARRSTELRGIDASAVQECQPAWQDVAHAIFNLQEFTHVP